MADEIITLHNPSRRIVPAAIAVSILFMFFPPLVLSAVHTAEPVKAILGSIVMLLLTGWFIRSAWKAPVEARFEENRLTLRSFKESHYELSQIRRWFFAIPQGLPSQNVPATNALLFVFLEDGAKFRGEVTAEEAALLARRLTHVAKTNAITD